VTALVILTFLLYREAEPYAHGEDGTVIARSCAIAEQHIRGGMQPGQSLVIHDCRPLAPEVAAR
jgi:hypothetical protein